MSLVKKISLSIAGLVIVVAATLGLTAFYFSSQAVKENVESGLLSSTQQGAIEVASTLRNQLDVLQEIANQSEVQHSPFRISKMSLEDDLVRLGYLDMALVDQTGKASYVMGDETENLGDKPYVMEGFLGHKNISDLIINPVSSQPELKYVVPVYRYDEVHNVLVARRDSSDLNKIIENIKYGKTGYAFIIDTAGVTLAHPDMSLVSSQFNVIEAGKSDDKFADVSRLLQVAVKGKPGIGEYEFDNKYMYCSYAPIEGSSWILVSVVEEGEVLASLDAMALNFFIAAIVLIILGVVLALLVSISIAKPIKVMADEILSIASYDLTETEAKHKYDKKKNEIGVIARSVNTLREELRKLVTRISKESHQVTTSSEALTAISEQSSAAAEEVARAIEEIANGASDQARETSRGVENIEEFGQIVTEEVALVAKLKEAAHKVEVLKNEGFEVLEALKVKTEESVASNHSVAEIIKATDASAEKIESANVMIQNLADQTSLLALNAAIEAARAGESGRGFAVVAEEIRKLAEQSNNFAVEISDIIKALLTKTDEAVEEMTKTESISQEQIQSLEETNKKFEGISEAVDDVNEISAVLDEFSETMKDKKEALHEMIESLSSVSQQNAAGTEEASASVEEQTAAMVQIAQASEALGQLAEGMDENISKFKL